MFQSGRAAHELQELGGWQREHTQYAMLVVGALVFCAFIYLFVAVLAPAVQAGGAADAAAAADATAAAAEAADAAAAADATAAGSADQSTDTGGS